MPQMMLPIFPAGVTEINERLAFKKADGFVTYFTGTMPIFHHAETDICSFKMIVSQFYVLGMAKQSEIVAAFGVNAQLIKRAVKAFRERGSQGFFAPKKVRGFGVLTESVLNEAQCFLDQGLSPGAVSERLGQKVDTIRKAILHGRLHRVSVSSDRGNNRDASSKSERSVIDSDGEMG